MCEEPLKCNLCIHSATLLVFSYRRLQLQQVQDQLQLFIHWQQERMMTSWDAPTCLMRALLNKSPNWKWVTSSAAERRGGLQKLLVAKVKGVIVCGVTLQLHCLYSSFSFLHIGVQPSDVFSPTASHINRFDAIEQRITVQFVKLHAHVPISTFKILRNYSYLLSENRTQLKSTGFQAPPSPSPPPPPPPVPLALRLPLPQLLPPGSYGGLVAFKASCSLWCCRAFLTLILTLNPPCSQRMSQWINTDLHLHFVWNSNAAR